MSVGAPTAPQNPIAVPGGLRALMDGLTRLQAPLPDRLELAGFADRITCYRWRPQSPDLPALWNWLLPSRSEVRDTARIRDIFTITTRIGNRYQDSDEHMDFVEAAADAYREMIDPAYWSGGAVPKPLSAFGTWGIRTSTQTFAEEFGSIPAFGVEFVTDFWLDRIVG